MADYVLEAGTRLSHHSANRNASHDRSKCKRRVTAAGYCYHCSSSLACGNLTTRGSVANRWQHTCSLEDRTCTPMSTLGLDCRLSGRRPCHVKHAANQRLAQPATFEYRARCCLNACGMRLSTPVPTRRRLLRLPATVTFVATACAHGTHFYIRINMCTWLLRDTI